MLNYILYRIGQFIAMNLPVRLAYKVAIFFADLHYAFAFEDRRAVKRNLKAIFPDMPDSRIRSIRWNMHRNFAKYLVDFFRFEKIDTQYIKKNIRVKNLDYFDQALAKGRGVIVLTAHLGNWELGGVVIALSGYPFWVVAQPHKHKKVNEFFNFQRESKGIRVIPLGRAVRACLNLLEENKMVALVGDRDFTESGVELDFFGKPTSFPEGPAAFALKTGAVIVPGFMVRNSDDTYDLNIERPIEVEAYSGRNKDTAQVISRYKDIIEDYIRKYPDQWYMFRQFWANHKP